MNMIYSQFQGLDAWNLLEYTRNSDRGMKWYRSGVGDLPDVSDLVISRSRGCDSREKGSIDSRDRDIVVGAMEVGCSVTKA
jgi:hypothetical protein